MRGERTVKRIASTTVSWRRRPHLFVPLAWLAAIAWPPLVLSLIPFAPQRWTLGYGADWRFYAMGVGGLVTALSLWLIHRERLRAGRPATRLGVVWRIVLFGAVAAVAVELIAALALTVFGWNLAGPIGQQLAKGETTFLLYGVILLPFVMAVGVSFAVWAGLAVAFIAFAATPPPVKPRLGLLADEPPVVP
ncbi:MAG TPA: phthalate transporter [Caulobacteraceae bacterium]|jgi:hypothetical protein